MPSDDQAAFADRIRREKRESYKAFDLSTPLNRIDQRRGFIDRS